MVSVSETRGDLPPPSEHNEISDLSLQTSTASATLTVTCL